MAADEVRPAPGTPDREVETDRNPDEVEDEVAEAFFWDAVPANHRAVQDYAVNTELVRGLQWVLFNVSPQQPKNSALRVWNSASGCCVDGLNDDAKEYLMLYVNMLFVLEGAKIEVSLHMQAKLAFWRDFTVLSNVQVRLSVQ